MNLYIKVVDGQPVNHPLLESNLIDAFQLEAITPAFLAEQGLVRFERREVPASRLVLSEDGYELCEDGVVRNVITTRELTQEEKLDEWVRGPRNFHLAKSDWTQMPDSPLSAEKKAEWAAYRQALRDMTTVYADVQNLSDIVPPTPPAP